MRETHKTHFWAVCVLVLVYSFCTRSDILRLSVRGDGLASGGATYSGSRGLKYECCRYGGKQKKPPIAEGFFVLLVAHMPASLGACVIAYLGCEQH